MRKLLFFFGRTSTKTFIKGLLRIRKTIALFWSSPVPMLLLHETGSDQIEEQQDNIVVIIMTGKDSDQELAGVARIVTLKTLSETPSKLQETGETL